MKVTQVLSVVALMFAALPAGANESVENEFLNNFADLETETLAQCDPETQPYPHWGMKNGQCLKSCGSLGGTASFADSCAKHGMKDMGQAYDVPYCCGPHNGGGGGGMRDRCEVKWAGQTSINYERSFYACETRAYRIADEFCYYNPGRTVQVRYRWNHQASGFTARCRY